jgi:hypothetical protein
VPALSDPLGLFSSIHFLSRGVPVPERIPSKVIKVWSFLKHDVLGEIDRNKDPMATAEHKKDTKKKVESLYAEFDKGLSTKLKKGSTTKSDEEAAAALAEAKKIATSYLEIVKKKKSEWGQNGTLVAGKFSTALQKIVTACDEALK